MIAVKPLSEDLDRLISDSEGSEATPVVRRWIALTGARAVLGSPVPDEMAVIDKVREMVRSSGDFFVTKPDVVKRLEARLAEIDRDLDSYLRDVLIDQRIRCERVCGDISSKEKHLSNLRRGLQKRLVRYEQLTGSMDDVVDDVVRAQIRTSIGNIFDPIFGPRPRSFTRRQRSPEQILHQYIESVIKLLIEIHDIENQIALVESDLSLAVEIRPLMERIDKQLKGILPTRSHSSDGVSRSKSVAPAVPNLGSSRKNRDSKPDNSDVVVQSNETAADVFTRDRQKMLEVVRIANDNKAPIRVILPLDGPVRQKFSRQWEDLLRVLGFTGEIRFIDYRDMGNYSDSPIIMPRRMNTHMNKRPANMSAPMFVIDVPPRLLQKLLEGARA